MTTKSAKTSPRKTAFRVAERLAARSPFTRFEDSPIDPEDYGPLVNDIDRVDRIVREASTAAGRIPDEIDAPFLYGLAVGLLLGRGGAR
jgi:hypothetical protein